MAIRDDDFPVVEALTGSPPPGLLEAALEEEPRSVGPGVLLQVLYRPGRRISVRYDATFTWKDGAVTEERVVALARRDGLPEDARTVEVAGTPVAVWPFPQDPFLPGLRRAADPGFVRGLLAEAGWESEAVELEVRAYRPARRAVIQATAHRPSGRVVFRPGVGLGPPAGDVRRFYLKVVRPERTSGLRELQERLGGQLPVAPCLAADEELGILVLGELPGATLASCLRDPACAPPAPGDLVGVLDALNPPPDAPRRPTSAERARERATILRSILPEHAERIDRFVAALGDDAPQPEVPIHGDFHEGQVLVAGGAVSGLVDVDGAGLGQRIDDLALIAGRVWTLAHSGSREGERAAAYAEEMVATFGELTDPAELRRRMAAAMLGRATAPFRNQVRDWPRIALERIQLAERWLDGA